MSHKGNLHDEFGNMSKKPININTATKEELMAITDRGQKRSGMITKC
jgi:DNA uptake protein ComE-like DNA-binding protein